MKKILSLLSLLMLSIVGMNAQTTVTYALSEGDTFKSGQTVEVKNGDAVVATITYGESAGTNDFKAAVADEQVEGFTAYTPGNDVNGNKEGGTFYTIKPTVDAKIAVAVVLNAGKKFYILEDGTALSGYNEKTVDDKYYGTYEFDAKAGKAYKVYCAGSKLGFYGFEMTFAADEPVTQTKSVTFINDANWGKVFVWAWNDTENFTGGEWPGQEITPNADGTYSWETLGTPTFIIFNNGAGVQTNDLEFVAGATYNSQGIVPEELSVTAVELRGAGVWDKALATFEPAAEAASTGYWTLSDVEFAANDEFKVYVSYSDGTEKWLAPENNDKFQVTKELLGQALELKENTGNMWVENAAKLSFSLNPGLDKLTITGELTEPVEVSVTSVELRGKESWDKALATFEPAAEAASTGYWTLSDVEFAANDEFKVYVSYSDGTEKWLAPESNDKFQVTKELLGQALELKENTGNMWVENAAKLSFSLNPGFTELTITGEIEEGPVEPIFIYAVVGQGGIFEKEWDQSGETNQMTLDETGGLYTWSVKNAWLEPQTIEFKVIKIGVNNNEIAWFPEDNVKFEIPEAGYWNIIVNFNAETEQIELFTSMREKPIYPQDNVYYWESPDGIVNENGGTAAHVGAKIVDNPVSRLNYAQGGYYTMCLNGKKANVNDEANTENENPSRIVVTLDNELKAGDKIAITAFLNKDVTKTASAYFVFGNGTTMEGEEYSDEANIHANFNGSPKTTTYTVSEEAAGSKTITLTRSQAGTNLFITKLEISRAEQPAVVINSMAIVGDFIGGEATEEDPEPWWNPTNGWPMESDDNVVWTLVKSGVQLTARPYYYKATANGKYGDYELPASGNNTLEIEETGVYDLVFRANTETHTLTATAQKQADPTEETILTLAGNADYTAGKAFLIEAADEVSATLTVRAGDLIIPDIIMEDGSAMLEIEDDNFTTGEFTITANKKIEFTKVILLPNADAAEGTQIWPEIVPDPDYFLVGTMNEWTPEDAYKLARNQEAEGEEYMINVDFEADAEFKIVTYKENEAIWYPNMNVKIDNAGSYTVYFRPNYDGGDGWTDGCIYVAPQPEPELIDIEWTALIGTADIAAEIQKEIDDIIATGNKVGNITIKLAKGGEYTLGATLTVPNDLFIYGEDATVNVAEGIDFITLDGTEAFAMKTETEASDHKLIKIVEVRGVTIKGLKGALVKDAQKTLVENLVIDWSNIEMPAAGKNVLDFNGKGYVGKVVVTNSTIWANGMNTGFFAQYGSRPKNVNGEWLQEFYFENNTIVNIANGKNFCDLKQNGTAQNVYTLKNNIFVDCGKSGQTVVGFNKGQTSATPAWDVTGNYFEAGGACTNAAETEKAGKTKVLVAEEAVDVDVVQNCVDGKVTFADAANGDFNGDFDLAEGAEAPESLGAPMWTITFKAAPKPVPYFLVGNMTNWQVNEDYRLKVNPDAEGDEYMIALDLQTTDQFKIVKSEDGVTVPDDCWYPTGMGNNYGEHGEITEADNYTVFFRPNGDGGDNWFYYFIFVQKSSTVGINAVAANSRNLNGAAIYNLNGQRVMNAQKGLYIVNGHKVVIK